MDVKILGFDRCLVELVVDLEHYQLLWHGDHSSRTAFHFTEGYSAFKSTRVSWI